jgi:hypothetical protein
MNEIKIYALVSPNMPDIIRYVGITKRDLNTRLNEHWCSKNNKHTAVAKWNKSLELNNLKPQIKLLDICLEKDWEDYERFYISYYKNNKLLNYEPGGKTTRVFKKYKKVNVDSRKKTVLKICIKSGKILQKYDSTSQVEDILGLNKNVIASACRGLQQKAYGYHWEYKGEKWVSKLKNKKRKVVYQSDKDDNIINIFKSVVEASDKTGYSKSYIAVRCRNEKSTGEYKWKYKFKN